MSPRKRKARPLHLDVALALKPTRVRVSGAADRRRLSIRLGHFELSLLLAATVTHAVWLRPALQLLAAAAQLH
ncbi:hypothetical protein [Gryllotalpicola protaetiae]|uniref:hypothetical protein n=1 Tax=Gryllotalpicola protaetiae TaxID=2419771 RepID=UPI0013C52BEA|nr:hypothetical protein [Gryllotalpicola protaetiae]